jgi:hypothetical protein
LQAASTGIEIEDICPAGGEGAIARPAMVAGEPTNTSPIVTAGPLASMRGRSVTVSACATAAPKNM